MQCNQYVETEYISEGRKKYNLDTKDTAEKTAPSVARAKPAPAPKPAGEPEPEEPVPSVPLSQLGADSLEGLGAAFSGLSPRVLKPALTSNDLMNDEPPCVD